MDMILGAIIGFVSGYWVGTRDGKSGYAELRDAWQIISASEEYKAVRTSAPKIMSAVLQKGITLLDKWLPIKD